MEKNKNKIIAELKAKFEEKEKIAEKFNREQRIKHNQIEIRQMGGWVHTLSNKLSIDEFKEELKFGIYGGLGLTSTNNTKTFIKELQEAIKLCEKLNKD